MELGTGGCGWGDGEGGGLERTGWDCCLDAHLAQHPRPLSGTTSKFAHVTP